MLTLQKAGFGQSFQCGKENIERQLCSGLIQIIILSNSNFLIRMMMR